MKLILRIFIAATLFALIGCGQLLAQTPTEQEDDLGSRYGLFDVTIDELSQELADEYLDILTRVQNAIEDYSDLLADMDAKSRQEHEISTDVLKAGLKDGTYERDPDQLIHDIHALVDTLKDIEASHKAKYNTNSPRCCRVVRNLRKELVIVVDLIEDYDDQQLDHLLQNKGIQEYLEQAAKKWTVILDGTEVDTEKLEKAVEEYAKGLENLHIPGEEVIFIPRAPQPPRVGAPPDPGRVPNWFEDSDHSEIGLVRKYQDSLAVSSGSAPIEITLPVGDLKIVGWDDDMIVARLAIEVSSKTRAREKQFVADTDLKVTKAGNGYSILAQLPEISDTDTKILRSVLYVNVPMANHVMAEGSYGTVGINDLEGGLTVRSAYSNVNIDNVEGSVEVSNSYASIFLSEVTGDISASNQYGAISISECQGALIVNNLYAQVQLADCEGDVRIKNSGQIRIDDHHGNMTIDNQYGQVEIAESVGDIVANNAYQPLILRDIDGDAHLTNMYSHVYAFGLNGELTVTNNSGAIQGERLQGPVYLTNNNGDVNLTLDDRFAGETSTVETQSARIILTFADLPDLRIESRTDGGHIKSSLAYDSSDEGRFKTAKWVLGDGSGLLSLSGKGVSVVVREE